MHFHNIFVRSFISSPKSTGYIIVSFSLEFRMLILKAWLENF